MALKEFDAVPDVTQEDLCKEDYLFRSLDRNQDGILAFDEFVLAVKAPMPLDEWASSLPLAQLLADAMPRKAGKDRLREVSRLTEAEIGSIADGFAYGVKRLLNQHVQSLRSSFSTMDQAVATRSESDSHLKFQTETTKLRCGNIEDFHNGMSSRIGAPLRFGRRRFLFCFCAPHSLAAGHAHLSFEKAMRHEHCHGAGSKVEFQTRNYRITTWAEKEWNIVLKEAKCPLTEMGYGRRIPDVDELMKCEESVRAKLIRAEVIAAVLYSGPMVRPLPCSPCMLVSLTCAWGRAVLCLQYCSKAASTRYIPAV